MSYPFWRNHAAGGLRTARNKWVALGLYDPISGQRLPAMEDVAVLPHGRMMLAIE